MNVRITREDCEKIDIVRSILEKEYKNHYTNQQLAQKVNTNESKLQYGFKQLHKMTVYEYLRRVRIEKAKELIMSTDHPIKSIARLVGYEISNFNKRFKQVMGVSPLMWRDLQKIGT